MADNARRKLPGWAGRWGRAVAVVVGAGLVVSLTACATNGTAFTPKPVVTITPPAPPRTSPSPSASTSSPSTPAKSAVSATGSFALFGTVSTALKGTCQTVEGAPTLKLADHKNDFYGTVDLAAELSATKKSLVTLVGMFGGDSEGFTWKLAYSSSSPVKGTSARLTVSGNTYTAAGKLRALETRDSKVTTEILPFKLVVTCASADW